MKKITKRLVSLLLAAVLVFSLAACGKNDKGTTTDSKDTDKVTEGKTEKNTDGDKAPEQITLNVWHQWSNDTNELKKLYDQAVAEYIEANPHVKIDIKPKYPQNLQVLQAV